MDNYRAVRETNDDAATCKLCCVNLGYYADEYLKFFVKDSAKRPPLINRGYWARVSAYHKVMQRMIEPLSAGSTLQVVNLGAGFDTTFWNIQKIFQGKPIKPIFYEVDLLEVVAKKISIISKTSELLSAIEGEVKILDTQLHGSNYHLLSVDLNDVESLSNSLLVTCKIDPALPTIFLSECVLIYLESQKSDQVIDWISSTFKCKSMLTYEQILPSDNFGSVMIQNLKKRGCPLLGISRYPNLQSQKDRYFSRKFEKSSAEDMLYIYNKFLSQVEIQRIQKIEFLDEYEEWIIILQHYALVWSIGVDKDHVNYNDWMNVVQF